MLSVAAAPAAADIRFEPPRGYDAALLSSGFGPGSVASADFDADGSPDLAVADFSPLGPSVLLGRGDGSFKPPVRLAAGTDGATVATGDLDRDGDEDLIAGSYGSRSLTVFLGGGDGTFAAGERYATNAAPLQVAVADFDDDGHRDLAVMSADPLLLVPGDVTLLRGRGDGTFVAGQQVLAGRLQAIATADLDADGDFDLIVGEDGGDINVLLGNGDGTFAAPAAYPGRSARFIAPADVDDDGALDFVTANGEGGYDLSLFLGRGDGTFRDEIRLPGRSESGAGGGPDPKAGVTVADFDGDGHQDIASTSVISGRLSLLAGLGDARFAPAGEYSVEYAPEPLVAADFDGDGRPDLAVPTNLPAVPRGSLTAKVAVLLNDSSP